MNKDQIREKLKVLPKGNITIKRIKSKNGKTYEYSILQYSENKKQVSRVLKNDEVDLIKSQLEERKRLEKELLLVHDTMKDDVSFYTDVKINEDLLNLVSPEKKLKKREGYKSLEDYIYGNSFDRVFILYGLRRTGKSTLIKQIIAEMSLDDFNKSAYIKISRNDSLALLNKDLKKLLNNGYIYVFIDEVTLMEDFIEGAALLSDIYAGSGMKIVLTGTDSLGFWISKSNELYDRCFFLHTTFIPYREFERVLGIHGIDSYIQYGGTMSMSGLNYNNDVFIDKNSTDEYVDSAIAKNIQHSLRCYQYEDHFRSLYSLYEKKELTNAINRVVEDMNHQFTIDVLIKDFKSSDLVLSSKNLRKDKNNPTTILDDINVDEFTKRLRKSLDIKNKDEQEVEINEFHVKEIKEYLLALDLFQEVDIVDIDNYSLSKKRIIFTQPGLRYSQAKSFIDSLSFDKLFSELSFEDKKRINNRILSEIKGRMMEDIVLLETKIAKSTKNVFKLQFSNGEYDMAIFDPKNGGIEIYEIKYSKEINNNQIRHLINEEIIKRLDYKYGGVTKKAVIYRGESKLVDDISYINVEEYLKNLA